MRHKIQYRIHDTMVVLGPISLIAALAMGYSGIAFIIVLTMFILAD